MKAMVIPVGSVFGKFTVVDSPIKVRGTQRWLSRCECGRGEIMATSTVLKDKAKTGVGCYHCSPRPKVTHRMTETKTYRIWSAMKSRCSNPNHSDYHLYGGRGVKVCERWQSSFEAFLEDMGVKPEGLSIDRINSDGNYEPGNCRWATDEEQGQNTRRCIKIELAGVSYPSLAALCRAYSLSYSKAKQLLRKGVEPEQIARMR